MARVTVYLRVHHRLQLGRLCWEAGNACRLTVVPLPARTTDFDRRLELQQVWLAHEDLLCCQAELANLRAVGC